MDKEESMETIRHLETMTWYEKHRELDFFSREEKTGRGFFVERPFSKEAPNFLWSL